MSASFQRRAALLAAAGGLILWQGAATAAEPPSSFASVARSVTPAVVNIQGERQGRGTSLMPFEFPRGTPFEDLFRRFRDQEPRAQAQGTGFIVDPAGYIVTNGHVVAEARSVSVTLEGGRKLSARVVGIDDQTDIALVKVEAGQPLPAVAFGDSDKAEVGDWVLAVGNPFGLGGTVTAGIVSARGRNLNAGPYDDFLQVDAPINMGNSGGPLFSLEGKVIGINTAIVTPNRGSVGIGFAIPSNVAGPVVAQLKEKGSVERGWLGVQIQPVTEQLAEALALDKPQGAMVSEIVPGSPADKAGVQAGDVILAFERQAVEAPRDLLRLVAATPAGKSAAVEVWRDRARQTIQVVLTARGTDAQAALPQRRGERDRDRETAMARGLGAGVSPLTRDLREQYDIPGNVAGVVVTEIVPGGAAEASGLRPGDVIQKVGSRAVANASQLESELRAQSGPRTVVLQVNRQGAPLFVGVRLG